MDAKRTGELELAVRARYAAANLPDTPENRYIRRLLADSEFALRAHQEQPHILDPHEDATAEALGDGNFRRGRLPSADEQ